MPSSSRRTRAFSTNNLLEAALERRAARLERLGHGLLARLTPGQLKGYADRDQHDERNALGRLGMQALMREALGG